MKKIATSGLCVLVFAWLVPNHYSPWISFYNEFLAAVGLWILALSLFWHTEKLILPRTVGIPVVLGLLMIGGDWYAGRIVFQSDVGYGLIYLSILLLSGVVGANLGMGYLSKNFNYPLKNKFVINLTWSLVVGALVSAIIGTIQWMKWPAGLWIMESQGRAYSNLAQPNHYATLLAMGVGGAGLLFETKQVSKSIFYGIVLWLCWGVLSSESRTGFLAVALIFVIWTLNKNSLPTQSGCWWRLIGVLTIWMTARVMWPRFSELMGASESRNIINFHSDSRLILWKQLGAAIVEHPWHGYGWLQIGRAQDVVAPEISAQAVSYSHNLFLDITLWFGLPLSILLLILSFKWIQSVFVPSLPERIYPLAVIAPLALHSMLEFPYAYTYFLIAGGLFVGVISAMKNEPALRLPKFLLVILLISTATAGMALMRVQTSAEEPLRMALSGDHLFGGPPVDAPPSVLGLGVDVSALIETLSYHGPETPISVEQAKRIAWRYPSVSTHRRRVISLFGIGDFTEACRALTAFKSLYDKNEYLRLLLSIRLLINEKPSSGDSLKLCH
ncbi:O-antigen ligase family protein [Paracidovorax valerianellae]|uniref:O-antigen ligase n=1 Tax=Paracidovorax valerianellae TaxID=187868 RepID=A0A1G6RVY3_9BURK|nr:O-antigen ligase family protein [Paracidovorax valerianellae]MDA8445991.1 Wzy polymerase domain-containing protein [Paracidovorax valerianellae]SDD08613.1 O-antigen ligase [Paracidovorax valerianellae]